MRNGLLKFAVLALTVGTLLFSGFQSFEARAGGLSNCSGQCGVGGACGDGCKCDTGSLCKDK